MSSFSGILQSVGRSSKEVQAETEAFDTVEIDVKGEKMREEFKSSYHKQVRQLSTHPAFVTIKNMAEEIFVP